ncbi:MAG: DUF362 domain-containing protein [Bacteroidales bacterium]|nr:MAG: DUF362 domain-containing protein [Bacteroidales bacterium]
MKITLPFFKTCAMAGRITGIRKPRGLFKIFFFVTGIISLIWFLIRVIPRPSRARYPCMKATIPIAWSFIAYILSLSGSVVFFRKAVSTFRARQFRYGIFIMIVAALFGTWALINNSVTARADLSTESEFSDPLGVNSPIGDAKGIFPGRVVWIHDPSSTREDCDPDRYGDGYFLDKNCDQEVVNNMVSEALRLLTGADTDDAAWDSVFIHFNRNHEKGAIDYSEGEKIFIKINSVHAWTTDNDGNIENNGSYGAVDASPHVVHAMLDQLINKAGVPQDNISVGDPYTKMFNHCYDKWSADFPDVHYIVSSSDGMDGREVVTRDAMQTIYYSDRGEVLGEETDDLVDCISNADYILNIPAYKAHRWGGVTFFAKNHFGSNSRGGASHLHPGLHREDYGDSLRDEYNMYRVFVDLMGSKYLGGNTLVFLMDALWGTSEEHLPPAKFQTAPFNNDWSSSIIASFDPVAIESVCLDIMQKEFQTENQSADPPRYTFVQWGAVDDYLHQAASSEWWPEGITYDPDNTGSPLGSLGVHEHWNNTSDMEYSHNLGTGNGIELIKSFHGAVSVRTNIITKGIKLYPNPSEGLTKVCFELDDIADVSVEVYTSSGNRLIVKYLDRLTAGKQEIPVDTENFNPGVYFCKISIESNSVINTVTKKFVVK